VIQQKRIELLSDGHTQCQPANDGLTVCSWDDEMDPDRVMEEVVGDCHAIQRLGVETLDQQIVCSVRMEHTNTLSGRPRKISIFSRVNIIS
jgi:hypothetical protein